jgi:hypothetical protein
LGLYVLAHLLLPTLYLPSRYTYHSFRFIMPIAAGLTVTILVDAGVRSLRRQRQRRGGLKPFHWVISSFVALLLTAAVVVPFIPDVVDGAFYWQKGKAAGLYQFIGQQPPETLVASLSEEADNIPSFSLRPVLVGREFALPYQMGYYQTMRQRIADLIQAQYSPDLATLTTFIQQYDVDLLVLDRWFLDPNYITQNHQSWLMQYQPAASTAIAQLQQGETPAIVAMMTPCTVWQDEKFVVLNGACIVQQQTQSEA